MPETRRTGSRSGVALSELQLPKQGKNEKPPIMARPKIMERDPKRERLGENRVKSQYKRAEAGRKLSEN